jgi:DNA-binding Lrp family transcriptional regulator
MSGYCWASNTQMGNFLNISNRTISRLLSELEDAKYIKRGIKKGIDAGIKGTERKIFILIDTSQWGIVRDDGGGCQDWQAGMTNLASQHLIKEKDNANAYFFRNLKEFFIKRVFDLKGISYVFSGGRDGNAIKQFLARKIRPDHAKLIDFYLKSEKAEHNLSISAALSADTINQFNLKFNRETEVSRIWKSLN